MHRTAHTTLALFVLAAVLAAGCGGGETVEKVDTGSTAPTSPSGSAETDFAVGDTVKTAAGNTITAVKVEPWESPNPYLKPEPGHRYITSQVHACASETNDGAVSINPFDFALQMSDDSRLTADAGWRDPALNATELLPGDCVRGWVTFEAPKAVEPKAFVFVGASIIRWNVP